MLASKVRSWCWWYGSRVWMFPTVFHYVLLLCDRWQQRGSLTKRHLMWKYGWSKSVSLKSSTWKKVALIDIHQCLLNVYDKQTVDVSIVGRWVVHFNSADNRSPPLVQIFMSRESLVKMHSLWCCLCWKSVFHSWEFALINSVIVFFVSVEVSMGINRRHYFWNNLCTRTHQ